MVHNFDGEVERVSFHGLECVRLRAGGASVLVSLFGAHVLSWIPGDGRERLFLSDRAIYDGKSAIRGGVPVCFPQFSGLGNLPKHGFVRNRPWRFSDVPKAGNTLSLTFRSDTGTRAVWEHDFELALALELSGDRLAMRLLVRNTGDSPLSFTGALHTYFQVSSIDEVALFGLDGCEYRDAAGGNAIRLETEDAIRFGPEIDRVYHDAPRMVRLQDGAGTLAIASTGFADTVVWNPGAALCAQMADMAPPDYRRMVCVEAAAARTPVSVAPGGTWSGEQILTTVTASSG